MAWDVLSRDVLSHIQNDVMIQGGGGGGVLLFFSHT